MIVEIKLKFNETPQLSNITINITSTNDIFVNKNVNGGKSVNTNIGMMSSGNKTYCKFVCFNDNWNLLHSF
jgi:hypothetical protein